MDPVDLLSVSVGRDPDGTPVIALAGQLDLASAAHAEEGFAQLPQPADGALTPLVVDLGDLTFMDSSGLTVLLRAVRRGYAVRLRNPPRNVRRVVDATGLAETLPVEP